MTSISTGERFSSRVLILGRRLAIRRCETPLVDVRQVIQADGYDTRLESKVVSRKPDPAQNTPGLPTGRRSGNNPPPQNVHLRNAGTWLN